MKIFFHAPITDTMQPLHQMYFEYIEQLGHTNTTDFSTAHSAHDMSDASKRNEAKKYFRQQELAIKKADVVVLGATEQSIGTGVYMNMAKGLSKPIVALTQDVETMPFLYLALDYNKLLIRECDESNYKTVIPDVLSEAQRIVDKRFTLLLPPDVVEMLDNHYTKSGQTRSDYIRDLIRHDQQQRNQNASSE